MKNIRCIYLKSISIVLFSLLILPPRDAAAYVGPGTGISLIGAIVAVIAAVLFTVGGVLLYPFRALKRWISRRKGEEPQTGSDAGAEVTDRDD